MTLKQIEGYEGLYSVSSDGRVWSHERIVRRRYNGFNCDYKQKGLWMKPSLDKKGYHTLNLCKNGKHKPHKISRLVGEAYIPNLENKPQINHKNRIKTDNRADNLEWVTNRENFDHGMENGMFDNRNMFGENNNNSKLTQEQVNEIRSITRKKGNKIWKNYGISDTQYYRIINNESWKE